MEFLFGFAIGVAIGVAGTLLAAGVAAMRDARRR